MEDDDNVSQKHQKKVEEEAPRPRPKKIKIPRRMPSVVIPPKVIQYITPDKTTCADCPCFPKEEPYTKPKKLKPCQMTPWTLYELAAEVVDSLKFPEAYNWTVDQVADWMANVVGLPEYRNCILDNHINGRRLLFLEDPSHMPPINIHCKDHIFMITAKVREAFGTEFVRFARSIGLPPRLPLTHCTWFKSRTGPSSGIRENWSRTDILRWMKIINSKPLYLDHWDLVWYWPPDFPKTRFARLPPRTKCERIPHYTEVETESCREYLAPRKFRLQRDIPSYEQLIWMEHRPGSPVPKETELAKQRKEVARKRRYVKIITPTIPVPSRLDPPKIDLTGLMGKDLLLARRLMPRKKFMDRSG